MCMVHEVAVCGGKICNIRYGLDIFLIRVYPSELYGRINLPSHFNRGGDYFVEPVYL